MSSRRGRVAGDWPKDDDVILRLKVFLPSHVLRADVGIGQVHLIKRNSPPTLVLRVCPGVHQRQVRRLNRVALNCRSIRDGIDLNAEIGRGLF